MADYIRVKPYGASNLAGYKILVDIVTNFTFDKGFDDVDISLPGSTARNLLVTSGLKEDYSFNIEFADTGVNKAYSIDNIGNESIISSTTTTAQQLNWLLDTFISSDLGTVYQVYIDWNGKAYEGLLRLRGQVSGENFFNRISVSATLKVGSNILGL